MFLYRLLMLNTYDTYQDRIFYYPFNNIIRQCLDSEPHHRNWTNDYVVGLYVYNM